MISAARVPFAIAVLLAARALVATSLAADYPLRSISLIVPGPVGGTTDTLCHMVADKLRGAFEKPVVVRSRCRAAAGIR